MTCWRRLRDWQATGVWEALHHRLLDWLGDDGQVDWSRATAPPSSDGGPAPVLLDPSGTIAQRLQVTAIPVTFVLDRDGRIAARLEGRSTRRTLSARLDALRSGEAARQPP